MKQMFWPLTLVSPLHGRAAHLVKCKKGGECDKKCYTNKGILSCQTKAPEGKKVGGREKRKGKKSQAGLIQKFVIAALLWCSPVGKTGGRRAK